MRWRGERESDNVEDRRFSRGTVAVGGGLGTLVIVVLALLFGADPQRLLQQLPNGESQPGVERTQPANGQEDELKQFVRVVLAKTEDVWQDVFRQNGKQYRDPKLVLFTDRVESACGIAGSATGPFYCPGDEKVYIDLAFYRELKEDSKHRRLRSSICNCSRGRSSCAKASRHIGAS